MKKSLIHTETGKVVNNVVIDPQSNWKPPNGYELREGGAIGQIWNGSEYDVPDFGHVATKIAEVKAEANRRILDRMPDFKQRNYIAFNLEMEKKERKGGTLTTEELAMVTFTEGEWEFAKAIRSASNVIEAEIALLTDVEAGVFDVENHPLWVV